ncbi:MAG: FAD-binding protein [Candidatus Brocadiae bacterium]|nr:FAD-binding protein [Candidatus Brocadiia bacterium]
MLQRSELDFDGLKLPVFSLNTVVVGSGAAGLCCAARLWREMAQSGVDHPEREIAVVTRGMGAGTSHNAGSDKQTYYKLGTHGSEPDTPHDFAETLTAGGCAHGDVALVEAENSLRAFYHLVEIGVPFPHNARGGFVGYKTDLDPRQRGTSAGPWTSRFMVRKLHAEINRCGIPILDGYHVLAVVCEQEEGQRQARGLLCADMSREQEQDHGLVLFNCRNVVMAGGGPGELYSISVYPKGQMGPYAAMLEAGAVAHNLTESQFGLASLGPRWNLSGTYQQVIPRYYSTDRGGGDVREFLNPWFDSMATLATDIFLKGYQWPFDPDKVPNHGSSLIDVLLQNEMINRGRRVFVDFRRNPIATDGLEEFRLQALGGEALTYLQRSGATQPTPIERLAHMNQPSIDLYREMGVDLRNEPLEVGVCNQHCNGGFAVDWWWESNVRHLFVVGELAGTHGVKRPGGSALNSGQVGALRAAQRIAHVYHEDGSPVEELRRLAGASVARFAEDIGRVKSAGASALDCERVKGEIQERMSRFAGMVRSPAGVKGALASGRRQWRAIREKGLRQRDAGHLKALEVRELTLAHLAFLEAIQALLQRGSGSRGSHLVTDPSGLLPHPDLGDEWKFLPEDVALREEIIEITYDAAGDRFETRVTSPRPLPTGEFWFENTWAEFRDARIFQNRPSDKPRPYRIWIREAREE